MNRKVWILAVLVFSFLPLQFSNAQTNFGFTNDTVWYSKDPFSEGEKIKVFTTVFNRGTRELSGSVSFFDKNVLLGKKDFVVNPKGVLDISIDWTPGAGTHTVFARIDSAKYKVSNGKYETAPIEDAKTEDSNRAVKKVGQEEPKEEPNSIRNIQNIVTAQTPDIISKPLIYAVNKIEGFRNNLKVPAILKNRYIFYGFLGIIAFYVIRKLLRLAFGR